MRDWTRNEYSESETTPVMVLGIKLKSQKDKFFITVSNLKMKPHILTRTTLLLIAQQIFGAIGLTVPVSLTTNIILQQSWCLKIG